MRILPKRLAPATSSPPSIQFPHCDARILHAPLECEYCDRHPDWQRLRETWNIAFTGHAPAPGQTACPADVARPPGSSSDHRHWGGNVAWPAHA